MLRRPGGLRGRHAEPLRRALIGWARGGGEARSPDAGAQRPRVYILLMHAWGMGGTIRTTLQLAGYLSQTHDVEILSVIRRRRDPFFPFPPGVTVTAIDDMRKAARVPRLERPLRAFLSRRTSVLMHGGDHASERASLWTDLKLASALRERRRGVLISTRPALNIVAASVAPPSLVRIGQEHMNLSTHRQKMQAAIATGYTELDALVTLTERDLAAYRRVIGDGPLLTSIPNATAERGGLRSDGSSKTVIAAGRLARQKGYARLILAFERVVRVHPDWNLVICGGGPRRKHLEREIERRDMGAHVTLAGPVKDVVARMAESSIYALSSRFEGFPMVLLEAMSVGLPVVSFDCPTGPREIVEHRRNGLLVPEGDPHALAAALVEMIEDHELRRQCSEGALATAERYSLKSIGPRWEALIAQLSGTDRAEPAQPEPRPAGRV